MDKRIYAKNINSLLMQRKQFLGFSVALLILSLTQAMIIFALKDKQMTILLPPKIDRPFMLSAEGVSKSYLEEMSLFLTGLLFNVSPATAKNQYAWFLRYVSSKQYDALSRELMQTQARYRKRQMSTVFYPKKMQVNKSRLQVSVCGELELIWVGVETKQKKACFRIQFEYNQGQLWVKSFNKEIQGNSRHESIV